jgi:hypothetical protein
VRHTDKRIDTLLRGWGLRTHKEALQGSFELHSYDEMMTFFRDATRETGLRDFTQRVQTFQHPLTGEPVNYDAAAALAALHRLRADGHVSHAAAAMRYGYGGDTISTDYAAFNRSFNLPADYLHEFIDAQRSRLRGRGVIEMLRSAIEHNIPASYLGTLPLRYPFSPAPLGYTIESVKLLRDRDIPADYAAAVVPLEPTLDNDNFSAFTTAGLYRAGVDAHYARSVIEQCGLADTIKFFRAGIPPEFAAAMSGH